MRSFLQNKLWCDKAVGLLEMMGSKIHWIRLGDEAFDRELRVKLVEETQQVVQAKTRQEMCSELADIQGVIASLCALHGISLQEVTNAQMQKRSERGGFEGRRYVTVAEYPAGSFGEKYCLNDPDKYPEIVN